MSDHSGGFVQPLRMMETVSFGFLSASSPTLLHRLGVDLALHLGDVDHAWAVAAREISRAGAHRAPATVAMRRPAARRRHR